MKRLIEFNSKMSFRLTILLLMSLLVILSCEESTGPEVGSTTSTYKLLITPGDASISSSGGSTQVLVKVYSNDDTTSVISGVSVNFEASQAGTDVFYNVDNSLTDADGIARATIYAGSKTGAITVTASIQVNADEKYSDITVITVLPTSGLVTAVPTEIIADGLTQTLITATVVDSTGQPKQGILVTFTTTAGVLSPTQAVSDVSGRAMTTLTSISSMEDVFATVTASTASIAKISAAEKTEDLIGTVTVIFLGKSESGNIVMRLTSSPSVLSANGNNISRIKASLTDSNGNPIQEGKVYFSTTDGVIKAEAETDEWGEASVDLKSARYNAIVEVVARYGVIEKSTDVEFEGTELTLQATPIILVANDEDSSKLTVSFSDASNSPIVDEKITLSTTLGTLTTADGLTSGTTIIDSTSTDGKLTAFITSDESGNAQITASAIGSQDGIDVSFTNFTFTLVPEETSIVAGSDTTTVTARLVDIDGTITPIDINNISFSTNLGSIGAQTINPDGTITVQLISSISAGSATVSADMTNPKVHSSASVEFVAASAKSILIEYNTPTVKLGGNSIELQATVFDETGNPKSDEMVTFNVLQGPGGGEKIIPGTAFTDERGQALVSFISGNRGSERDGVLIQAKLGNILSNEIKVTISGEPKSVQAGYADTYTENEQGTFSLEITAIVSDVNRNSVVDGSIVNFSLIGDAGVIEGQVPTLNGVATTYLLYSPSDAGKEVILTASASGVEHVIKIPLPGFTAKYFSIDAVPKAITVNGDSIRIDVTLFDISGSSENVPDGTMVAITSEGGVLNPSVARTVNGVATTYLVSDQNAGLVKVNVKSGDHEDAITVRFEEVGSIINKVYAIEINVDDPQILADGIESTLIHARLLSFDESIIKIPTTVSFETDIGEITSNVLSDSTTGIATAQFSSNESGTATVNVSVGRVSDITNIFLTPGVPLAIDLEFEPNSVGIQGSGRNETLIVTAHVKDNKNNPVADNYLVQFEIIGIPIIDRNSSLSPSNGSSEFISEPVPTVNGYAKVAYHSGVISGAVRIKATIVEEDGVPISPLVTSQTTEIQVFSGPPYLDTTDLDDPFGESRITIAGGPLNLFAGELNTLDSKSQITVLIGDKYNNPVPSGTSVFFSTTGGIVTTSTGYIGNIPVPPFTPETTSEYITEDNEGIAYVTLYAANPFPTVLSGDLIIDNPNAEIPGSPDIFDISSYRNFDYDGDGEPNDGIAIVTASTRGLTHDRDLDGYDDQVIAWNYIPIIFSKSVDLNPLSFSKFTVTTDKDILHLGETAILTIRLYDNNGNPVVGGSTLVFTSDVGALSPATIETTGRETTYTVSITNDKDPQFGISGNAVVGVKLTSPNGNISTLSPPILLDIP
ncbi:Ig-like domain-containing protein [Candidatus Latescibacterota bacterium]